MIGGDDLWTTLASSRRCDQIVGRIGVRLPLGAPAQADVLDLAAGILGRRPGAGESKSLIAAARCAGGLHALRRLMARLSLAEIAGWFGRDYTTALHSTAVVEDRIRDDPKYREFASSLRRQVRAWPASPPARDADAETAREVARLIASAERSLQSATRELERASALCDAMHGHRGRKGRFNRGGTAHQERSDE